MSRPWPSRSKFTSGPSGSKPAPIQQQSAIGRVGGGALVPVSQPSSGGAGKGSLIPVPRSSKRGGGWGALVPRSSAARGGRGVLVPRGENRQAAAMENEDGTMVAPKGYTLRPVEPAKNYDVISFARAMNDDFGPRVKKLFDPETEAALDAQKTGIYIGWRCPGNKFDCQRINTKSKCFCGHLLREHASYNGKSVNVKCKQSGCACKAYAWMPSRPEDIGEFWFQRRRGFDVTTWRAKCRCKHTHEEHKATGYRQCLIGGCKCGMFESNFLCAACDKHWEDHETFFEDTDSRRRIGLPVGIGRKVAIVNLDPANDVLPYKCDVDISDLITLSDVMDSLKLGPNGGLIYCMEYLEKNFDWLLEKLNGLKDCYLLFDCPGQVELFTHHHSVRNIFARLTKAKHQLAAVHLVDSHYCCDPAKFIAILLTSLSTMLQVELPHINVLSKADLIERYGRLPFNLDFFTEVLDMTYLIDLLQDDPFFKKFRRLNEAMAGIVEDYSLVSFVALTVKDKECMLRVTKAVDKANGYLFGDLEERNIQSLMSCAMGAEFEYEKIASVQEKYMTSDTPGPSEKSGPSDTPGPPYMSGPSDISGPSDMLSPLDTHSPVNMECDT